MNCVTCGTEIKNTIDGYELCLSCYQSAVQNQRLFWKELSEWIKRENLHIITVAMKGG